MKSSYMYIVLLHLILFFSTLGGVCSKYASQQPLFSPKFFLYYGLLIGVLGIYAIAWQQIIKKIPLTIAYLNKAITVIWGIFWGVLLFQETLTFQMGIGAVIVLFGIMVVVHGKY